MTNAMLTAIRAERDRRDKDALCARMIEAYALKIYEEGPGPDEPVPAGVVPAPEAGGGSSAVSPNPSREQILDYVRSQDGPVCRAQVHAALGGSMQALGTKLQRLALAGELTAVGAYRRRLYLPSRGGTPRAAGARTTRRLCQCPDDLLVLIRECAPVNSRELHELTGRTYPEITDWGHELACRGAVTFEREGRDRIWRPTPELDLTAEVAATIAADPGALDERRLALTLNTPEDRVGLACAELLDRGAVELTERNTYVPVTA